jgi:hypothetical protein
MQKLVSLFLLAACVAALHPEPAHAATELETWCIAQGASWQAENDRCLLLAAINATVTGPLALLPDETISNYGTITNDGDIDNDGTIDNFGAFTNLGHVENGGGIYNYNGGQVYNHGSITNESTIANYDIIRNYGTISNNDTINNWGTIYDLCAGHIGPLPPANWGSGAVYSLDHCGFLPVVTRG